MEYSFVASEVDLEPLTIDKTLFRLNEDDNVEDIPGLDDMPGVIRDTLLKHRSVFANDLSASKKIECEPLHNTLKKGVALPPRARLTAHHWRPRAEAIVRKMETVGILVRVEDVTPAVSAGFFVKKNHGNGIRFVADYTEVNKALDRNIHHFLAPNEVCQRVKAGSKYFMACDLSAGYWQCELDQKSSLFENTIGNSFFKFF